MSSSMVFVVGLPGVGKTTLSAQLAQLLSAAYINSGDALRAYMHRNGVAVDDIIETGNIFLRTFDEDTAGAAILSEARRIDARIIDGVRLFSTLEHFSASGITVHVVFIEANDEVRRSRFITRSITEGEATNKNAASVLSRKDCWAGDLERFARICKWRFDNSGPMERLVTFADSVAAQITGKLSD